MSLRIRKRRVGIFIAIALGASTTRAADTLMACDTSLGQQVFALCSACHTLQPGEPAREGPNLSGVIGSTAGSHDKSFKYSPALAGSKWRWDAATLDKFLTNPRRALPGTTMTFIGLKAASERAAVACYLQAAAATRARG
jgi:cytochrome c